MKTVGSSLKSHMALSVTTLALCWQVARTDGTTYYFTAHDHDLVVSGHTYLSVVGFTASAIQTGSTGQVDNLEVLGFLSDDGITVEDLKNGLFDYATIYLFMVNWNDLTMGICRLRRGWLGECVRAPSGAFQAELRGLTQALVQEFGNVYQPMCRADLGDSKCKMPIKPGGWGPSTSRATGVYIQAQVQNTDALLTAIFQAQNDGTSGSVEPTWDTTIGNTTTDGSVTWKAMPYWRGISTVSAAVDQHNFVSGALSIPAASVNASANAVISIRNNVSANTSVTVSDGVNSIGIVLATWDLRGSDAVFILYQTLLTSGLNMTVTQEGLNIVLVNNSGVQGDITKTGDSLGAIVIQNFATPVLDGGALTWLTGENAGRSIEIKTYNPGTNRVTLWLGMYFPIQVGDKFMFYAGCDKRRDTCDNTFKNMLNFRGEPDMPNMDAYLSYPDQ